MDLGTESLLYSSRVTLIGKFSFIFVAATMNTRLVVARSKWVSN